MKAIVVHQHGGPEVLQFEERSVPQPQGSQVLVQNAAIGVNFVDTQHRAGVNYTVTLPLIIGTEAAGVVDAVGSDVDEYRVGDRVAYAGYMGGNYAEYTLVPQDRLVPVPVQVSFELAAACLLQGMTAHMLAYSVYPLQPDHVVLVHAAAGGVGSLLVQMIKHRGARVIGAVSSREKAERARTLGADDVIVYSEADFQAETLRLTQGAGVHAVYDATGQTTFDKGIMVLRAQGYLIVYGITGHPVAPFDINRLSGITGTGNKGSLFLTFPTLNDYAAKRQDLLWRASEVLTWSSTGLLTVPIAQTFPLAQAAEAHRLLESRQVLGKILLLP